ncbi:putative ribonuclease H-like domain-containing protein [Tanacetum coccineum]|uniref:Ribonuclease H-like domain-containing protein n=1 Tax=Tanacetum coccineum TaxID=301880 RepID=A0ABQ5G588_9ASTR
MAFVSSPSSTNEVNTTYGVSTANTQVSPASTQDLEQIHEDNIEEIDLKWQLALLSMRTRRFFQKTGRKITINGSDTAGYDKSKVECFNCHAMRHFARECRGPRNQDNRNKNQDSSRRTVNVEEISSKAMLAIDGAGFDWSYMADDEVPTNMALMDFSDSESGVVARRMDKEHSIDHGLYISVVYEGKTHEDLHTCLFACFLSQVEPKKRALEQNESTGNKKDGRGLVNKTRQQLGVLSYASFKGLCCATKGSMSSMGELTFFLGLQVTQKDDGIFISQDKKLKMLIDSLILGSNDWIFDESLSHLLRPDLKCQPKIRPLQDILLTRGCQFLGSRLISWQCKKQTIVANSTTEAEYVAAASCYEQVIWIQNQMLDYGYNFMNTKIFIDNESIICIVKNPVFHSKTKHIEIRHHFIRDSNKKKLIQMIKIHIDQNVADLITKALDVGRFQYLIATADDAIQGLVVQGEGSTIPIESHHTPTGVDVRYGGAATAITSLEAG